eukprot:TRINITY_DN5361_c0_g1_i4.p1 TRINITY_DN5361_c0_g1~~TRINITY_DN5361_c0_g1_i4.p1  ORF type:complete len:365 (-),score=35.83 TRINITY_DN5361_c0_g1_i4:115-1209(-)
MGRADLDCGSTTPDCRGTSMNIRANSPILVGVSATTPSGSTSPCMEGVRPAKPSKLSWYDLTFDDSIDASLSDTVSQESTSSQSSDESALVDIDTHAEANIHEPIQLATLSAAPPADNSEDRAPQVVHTVENSVGWCIGSMTEFLSVGSAMHHAGTCVPCKFVKTKSGCSKGRACQFCHHGHDAHEEAFRNSKRRQRRVAGKRSEEFDRASSTDTSMSDTLSSLSSLPRTCSLSETSVHVDIDTLSESNIHKPTQRATLPAAPFVDKSESRAPHVSRTVEDSLGLHIVSTTELLSMGSARHLAGTCMPGNFMKTKSGCGRGQRAKTCHHPHEQDSSNSKRRQRKGAKIDLKGAKDALWSVTALG